MGKTWCIFKREVGAYFQSPVAYIITAVFLVLSGYFFSVILFATKLAEMRLTFGNMAVTFLFISPVLTMRLLADEKRMGTEELLMTAPVSVTAVVVGKFLAALFVYLIMLGVTLVYPLILVQLASPDLGPIFSGYLGLFLMGGGFLAVGLFASSLTENQMVAGMLGFGFLLFFWVLGWASSTLTGIPAKVVDALSILSRYADFEKGLIDSANVIYYLSFIFIFLFLTIRIVDRRRWSE